jgi:hypothetical protein
MLGGVRPASDVRTAFRLLADGLSQAEVARRTGVSRATIRDWSRAGQAAVLARRPDRPSSLPCAICPAVAALPGPTYAYLLGQYLGDGYLSPNGSSLRMRVTCSDAYPDIMRECADAMARVSGVPVHFVRKAGCTDVGATWRHWPCVVPHGPGAKHTRPIVLAGWQRAMVIDDHPGPFVRGLLHSDGCRVLNRVVVRGREYAYPRYFFTNLSADIRHLLLDACERLGIAARHSSSVTVSVARREAVARLDAIVGPKA